LVVQLTPRRLRASGVIAASLLALAAVLAWRLAVIYAPVTPGRTVISGGPTTINAGHLVLRFREYGLVRTCNRIATSLDFAIYCPNLLPTDATLSASDCCVLSSPDATPVFAMDSHFKAKTPPGHLLLIAIRRGSGSSALGCATPQALGEGPRVQGHPGHWLSCTESLGDNAGHLILAWEAYGIDYSMSLHGDTPDNRLAIELMSLNLILIFPGGPL
jgi:hypothetical protein